MNLALGCRAQQEGQWIYYLKDGTSMKREEWIQRIEQQIKDNGHEKVFEKIKQTVNLWNKQDTDYEVALHVYASKYQGVQSESIVNQKVCLNVVEDDMGYEQVAFF